VAAGKKNATRLNATIAFLDESGLLMAPLVRRTWAPRGQTPILLQRTRSRDKVSMVATLTVSPRRRRIGLYAALLVNANVNAERLVEYLRALLRHLRGPLILVWDRLNVHRSALVKALLRRHPRLQTELLPPYAPELNPVEGVWGYLKLNPLANHAAGGALDLARTALGHTRRVARRPSLLRSFIHRSGLPLRLR
jgi:transposase